MTKSGRILLVAIAVPVAWTVFNIFLSRTESPKEEVRVTVAKPLKPNPDGSAPIGPGPIAPYTSAELPRPVLTNQVAAVLPGVTNTVRDWTTYVPENMKVLPYPGVSYAFEKTSVIFEPGRVIWMGTDSVHRATIVATSTLSNWSATLEVPGANTVQISIGDEGVQVNETAKK